MRAFPAADIFDLQAADHGLWKEGDAAIPAPGDSVLKKDGGSLTYLVQIETSLHAETLLRTEFPAKPTADTKIVLKKDPVRIVLPFSLESSMPLSGNPGRRGCNRCIGKNPVQRFRKARCPSPRFPSEKAPVLHSHPAPGRPSDGAFSRIPFVWNGLNPVGRKGLHLAGKCFQFPLKTALLAISGSEQLNTVRLDRPGHQAAPEQTRRFSPLGQGRNPCGNPSCRRSWRLPVLLGRRPAEAAMERRVLNTEPARGEDSQGNGRVRLLLRGR